MSAAAGGGAKPDRRQRNPRPGPAPPATGLRQAGDSKVRSQSSDCAPGQMTPEPPPAGERAPEPPPASRARPVGSTPGGGRAAAPRQTTRPRSSPLAAHRTPPAATEAEHRAPAGRSQASPNRAARTANPGPPGGPPAPPATPGQPLEAVGEASPQGSWAGEMSLR